MSLLSRVVIVSILMKRHDTTLPVVRHTELSTLYRVGFMTEVYNLKLILGTFQVNPI